MSMQIFSANGGCAPDYCIAGNEITFEKSLTIDLEAHQKDWPEHLDVCRAKDGTLKLGVEDSLLYVAHIVVPAREYETSEGISLMNEEYILPEHNPGDLDGVSSHNMQGSDEDSGIMDNTPSPVPKPFDMSMVTLTLWSLDMQGITKM